MTIDIKANFEAEERTRKYVLKVIGSLDSYLPKLQRDDAVANVILRRVNRAHGNKYEAEITLTAGSVTLTAKDSTLNVLAAVDIVRRKLALDLKKS